MRPRCPFYGFRWPEHTTDLIDVGGNECGLDLDRNGPCRMEREGRTVNFECCEVGFETRTFLEAVRGRVRFVTSGAPVPFSDWRSQVLRAR